MKKNRQPAPQKSLLFRVIAFLSRLQFGYLYKSVRDPRILTLMFALLAGSTSLATIAITAHLTNLPLLFPFLGPSAFILFHIPMSATASPRNLILSHTLAVAVGLFSLHLFAGIFPRADLFDTSIMNWHRIFSMALGMGLISLVMISLKCPHPPAAATALIATMGFLDDIYKISGLIIAVVLLAVEGFFFNHILGKLPYPLWRSDPKVVAEYGILAGIPTSGQKFWEELARKTFQRR